MAANDNTHRIVALQGASNFQIQSTMWSCVRRWRHLGARIVGAIEVVHDQRCRTPDAVHLVDIASGRAYPLFQDLGPQSISCHLDGARVSMACEAVLRSMGASCDLVVLSKFGKLEASRSGLTAAFWAAIEHALPLLTAAAPTYAAAWSVLAGSLAGVMAPDELALDRWWQMVSSSKSMTRQNESAKQAAW